MTQPPEVPLIGNATVLGDEYIIQCVSALVVMMLNNLEPSRYTVPVRPLTEGRVLLGRQWVSSWSSPSQVVFVPIGSTFGPANTLSQPVQVNGKSQGYQQRIRQRSLATDEAKYFVYCWGMSAVGTHEADFGATRFLAHTVMRACQRLMMGSVGFFPGEGWIDQRPDMASLVQEGHVFCFGVQISMPVPDSAVAIVGTDVLPNGLTPVFDLEFASTLPPVPPITDPDV